MSYKSIFGCIDGSLGGYPKFGESCYGLTMKGVADTTFKGSVKTVAGAPTFGGASVAGKTTLEGFNMSYNCGLDAKGAVTGKYTVENGAIVDGLKVSEGVKVLPKDLTGSEASVEFNYAPSKALSMHTTFAKQIKRTSPVKFAFTGATEYMGFMFGFMKKYDMYLFARDEASVGKPKFDVTDMGIGAAYTMGQFHFAAGILSNFKKVRAGMNYKHNDRVSVGADFVHELEPAKGKTETEDVGQFGAKVQLDDGPTLRAKVNTNLVAHFGYEKKIAGVTCKLGLSTNLGDVSDTKLGLNFSVTE